jgi:ubiquinone/menaquinone biosynthesis C-methylase UbiE
MQMTERQRWRFKGPEMEGIVARWYAGIRGSGSQAEEYRTQASRLTAGLPAGADILEVAPGPGYMAIEMANSGRFHVTGLDISRTFVKMATENAKQSAVSADFRQGDAASLPFDAGSFDLVICQAAFKNFTRPASALSEMHRVLRAGGTAVIQDMSRDASHAEIADEVRRMQLGPFSAFTTKATLEMLRRRAYSTAVFERLASESPFLTCDVKTEGIGLEVRLTKRHADLI